MTSPGLSDAPPAGDRASVPSLAPGPPAVHGAVGCARDRTGHMTSDEIRGIPLFAGLSDAGVDRVNDHAAELEVAAGQILALPGDIGSGMFVVLDGTVVVELRGGPIELGPGEPVGELALIAPDVSRIARVRARTPVRCLGLARDDFLDLLESEPSFALALLRTLAARLAATPA